MSSQEGMTVIEVVVMVAILSMIMVTLTSVVIDSFQVNTKINYISRIEENGSLALGEIRRRLMAANPTSIVCGSGNSISFTDKLDSSDNVTISCIEGGSISMDSTIRGAVELTSPEVKANLCEEFVDCRETGSLSPIVEIGFILSAGISEPGNNNYTWRRFGNSITIRN